MRELIDDALAFVWISTSSLALAIAVVLLFPITVPAAIVWAVMRARQRSQRNKLCDNQPRPESDREWLKAEWRGTFTDAELDEMADELGYD